MLGEGPQPWCYSACKGKSANTNQFGEYGEKFTKVDVIGAFIDFTQDEINITYSRKGEDLGDGESWQTIQHCWCQHNDQNNDGEFEKSRSSLIEILIFTLYQVNGDTLMEGVPEMAGPTATLRPGPRAIYGFTTGKLWYEVKYMDNMDIKIEKKT